MRTINTAIIIILLSTSTFAQIKGDWRTISNGDFSNEAIWNVFLPGTGWVPLDHPNARDTLGKKTVMSNHTVSVNSGINLSNLEINGILTLNTTVGMGVNLNGQGVALNGTINGTAGFYIDSGAKLTIYQGGKINTSGNCTVNAGGNLTFTGNNAACSTNVTNNGRIDWIDCSAGGTGIITNNGEFYIPGLFSYSFSCSIINNGTITKNGPVTSYLTGLFTNNANVNINAGTLAFSPTAGTYSYSGNYNLANNGIVQFGDRVNGTNITVSGNIVGNGGVNFRASSVGFAASAVYNITNSSTALWGTVTFNSQMNIQNLGKLVVNGGNIYLLSGVNPAQIGADLSITSGTLDLSTGFSLTFNNCPLDYGTLSGSDSVTINGAFSSINGAISGTGALTLGKTSSSVIGFNGLSVNKTTYNKGVFNWVSGNINGSSNFYNDSLMIITNWGSSFYPPLINNGTINKTGTANGISIWNGFTNNGTVNVITGTFTCGHHNTGSYTHTGTFNVSSGTKIEFGNTSYNTVLNFTGAILGQGNISFGSKNSILNSSCQYNITGTTTFYSDTTIFASGITVANLGTMAGYNGVVFFQPGAIINTYNPDIVSAGGAMIFQTGKPFNFNNMKLSGTILGGSDTLNISGSMVTYGTIRNPLIINILASGAFKDSGNTMSINGTINNYGTFNWYSYINGSGIINNYGTINAIAPNGDSMWPTLNNKATGIIINPFNKTNNINGTFTNTGTVNIQAGTISMGQLTGPQNYGGVFTVASGATLSLGANYNVTHNFSGNVSGAGNIRCYDRINFNNGTVINITGTFSFPTSTATFSSLANLTNLGTILVNGGTANFGSGVSIGLYNHDITISSGTLYLGTGTQYSFSTMNLTGIIDGPDNIIITTLLNATGGNFQGTGKITINPTAEMKISGGARISKPVYNNGVVTWLDNSVNGTGMLYNNNIFTLPGNSLSAAFSVTNNQGEIKKKNAYAAGSTLTNDGIINVFPGGTISGSTFVMNTDTVYNNGTISCTSVQAKGVCFLSGSGLITSANFTAYSGGNLKLLSDHKLYYLSINSGGTVNVNGKKLSVSYGGTPISNFGTFITAGSIIDYNGTSAQTIATSNIVYTGLSINNLAGVTLTNIYTLNGTLYLTKGLFTTANKLTLASGASINRSEGTISVVPILSGKVNYAYTGSSAITTGAELTPSVTAVGLMMINNTAGVTLAQNVAVNDSLVFAAGNLITTNTYRVTLAGSSVVSGEQPSSYLVGDLYCQRAVGTNSSNMGNIGADISSGSDDIGTVTITRKSGSAGTVTVDSSTGINRQWIISSTNPAPAGRTVAFTWVSADDNNKAFSPANKAELWGSNGGAWDCIGSPVDVSAMSPRVVTVNGLTSFSTFTISAQNTPFRTKQVNITMLIQSLFDGMNTVQDTISVIFARPDPPYLYFDTVVSYSSSTGLLNCLPKTVANSDSFYVVLVHRNSIETWSAAPVQLKNYSANYDFTSSALQAYGENMTLVNGKYCLYSGDVNQDGFIDFTDLTAIDNDAYNFTSGYIVTDVNGDLFVDFTDLTIVDNNAYNFVGAIKPGISSRKIPTVPRKHWSEYKAQKAGSY
ncbi:MAG: hypothetical protein HYV28_03235 [Ignavibacteriales bacterium]|nr:hypothetical protein [Ignavibacteriales bacterium]